MAGSLAPVMYWAVRTTVCSALRSEAEQLPYQAVMQPSGSINQIVDQLTRAALAGQKCYELTCWKGGILWRCHVESH
jgi:hypothetical protein